jgi:hypothetical protein
MRPAILHVGGVLYWTIQTRNPDTQVLKDADSTPSVAVRKNGASVADSVTITKRTATTGLYDCSYNPAAEVEGDTYQFEESAAVTGTTTSSATYTNQFSVRAVHAGAVELDSAVGTQITNIETFATRVTTGLVQDGAVYQFTANMLELGPSGGGGSSVNVLPATGIVADRSAGTTLLPVVGETISQSITVYQSDGTTAVSLSGKTLKVIFETMSGVDVAVVAAADITISGTSSNIVTFAYPSAVTASERTLRFAIRDAAAPLTMYLQGVCSVVAAPKVDA